MAAMSVGAGCSPHVAAREGEVGFEIARHLVDVFLDRVHFRTVAEQREFELETRQDGPQVMRNAGQHRGALLDSALDAVFISRKAAAARRTSRAPRGRKFGASRPLPKALGGVGKLDDGPDLIAQKHRWLW